MATVLVNFGQPDDTVSAVEAVQAGAYPDNTVVVVDNDPDAVRDGALHQRLDPTVSYLPMGENTGYAAGNNAGIRFAIGLHDPDFAWVLNPDTIPETGALVGLVGAAEQCPDAALIGSRLVDASGRTMYNGASIDPVNGQTRHLDVGRPLRSLGRSAPFDTDYANGASMLIRLALVPIVGLIPEDYFLYFEETDYALRCQSRGFRVVVAPDSVVRHDRRSWDRLPTSTYVYYMVRNREIFSSRWGFDEGGAHKAATDHFVSGWREKISAFRPDLVSVFDDLVARAIADGEAGAVGFSDVPRNARLA